MKIFGNIRRQNLRNGFTIIEVVVAALIFAIATAGIFATVSSLSKPAQESTEEVTAAFLGKRILEDLRTSVDATTWSLNSSFLSVGTHTLNSMNIDGIVYTGNYIVTADPSGTASRQVTLNLNW